MSEFDPEREEGEAPRRGASAQLQVTETVAAEAAIRQAMDPANQSLGDALKLSYRLLQFAILGLLVTFLFSGFHTVKEGFSGVKTVFGRVVGDPGAEALAPGLTPFWPYPVGEITSFEVRRTVDLRREFWPRATRNLTTEQAVEAADNTQPLKPGPEGDGSLITGDGDLAHVQVTAEYTVEDPVRFLQAIDLEQADRLVRVALQRGVVVAGARMTLPELVEQREQPAQAIQAEAQRVLDDMASGITLARVTLPERSAPFAVRNELGRVQRNREDAKTAVDKARQDATASLLAAAGPRYEELLSLIDSYEAALSANDLRVGARQVVSGPLRQRPAGRRRAAEEAGRALRVEGHRGRRQPGGESRQGVSGRGGQRTRQGTASHRGPSRHLRAEPEAARAPALARDRARRAGQRPGRSLLAAAGHGAQPAQHHEQPRRHAGPTQCRG